MRLLLLVVGIAAAISSNMALAGPAAVTSCEDNDKDGRFGLVETMILPEVREPSVLRGNIGTYQTCHQQLQTIRDCRGANDMCACEDRDGDGRFGIVKHPQRKLGSSVLEANLGNYQTCRARMSAYQPNNAAFLTCDDYDGDGRFGIVRHALEVRLTKAAEIRPNHGTYYACKEFAQSASGCRTPNYCTCVDKDRDGRFSIFYVPGKVVGSRVIQPNIGNYESCSARMRLSDW